MEDGATYNCELIADTVGRKAVGGTVRSRPVKKTNSITLKVVNVSTIPNGRLLMFQTSDGYIIGSDLVRILSKKQSHSNVAYESPQQTTHIQTPTNTTVNIPNIDLSKKTNGAKKGVLIGGVGALILAIKYKQNKFIFTALGATLGGYIGGKVN